MAWASAASGNPTGPQVAAGQATFQSSGKSLTVTNSPGAILNWQSFSIGAGELTRFLQQSSRSAVLNRVIGADPSSILGTLSSNGRVFLINPHGIVFGQGAVINTAGLVASTLNLSDQDFLAGRLKFEGGGNGVLRNDGEIRASNDIFLVAPRIENAGLIRSESGSVLLAAGQSVVIASPDSQGVQFALQAPADTALNLGTIEAKNAAGMFAGTLRHSGDIRAMSASVDGAGRVILAARGDAIVDGKAKIEADNAVGRGGSVRITGERIGLFDQATVSARGATGGGEILIGGDFQGRNADVPNAWRSYVGKDVVLSSDATGKGDGGRVIVWSDDVTRFFGHASVRGGPQGGAGGLVEVSGKGSLVYAGSVALSAPLGKGGTLLLDPADINLVGAGGTLDGELNGSGDPSLFFSDGGANTGLSVTELTTGFTSGDTIALQATNNISFGQAVTLQAGVNLSLNAGNQISITQNLNTSGGNLSLTAANSTLSASVTTGGFTVSGALSMPSGTLTATGDITLNGAFNAGSATIAAGGGGALITSGTTTVNDFMVVTRNWRNTGTINLDDGLLGLNGVTFTNEGTVNINSTNTAPFHSLGNASIVNAGILNKNANVTQGFGNPFTNQAGGTLNVNDGTLQSTLNSTFDGTVTVAAGKTLEFTNSATTHTLAPGVVLGGGGSYLLNGGTLDVQGGNLPRLQMNGGTLTRSTAGDVTIGGAFGLVTGQITPGGGGALVTAGTTTATNFPIVTRNWRNTGTINLDDGLLGLNGVTFTNEGTVNINSTNTTPFHSLGNASIVNAGVINKNSTSESGMGNPYANQAGGTLNINSGFVRLAHGGSLDGTVNIGSTGELLISNGAYTASGTIVAAPGGQLSVTGGTLALGDGAVLDLADNLNFTGGAINLTGAGAGSSLAAGSSLNLAGVTLGGAGKVTNLGTLNLNDGIIDGVVVNQGTLGVTAGDGTINGAMSSLGGTVTVGGGHTLTVGGTGLDWQGGTLAGAGTYNLVGGLSFSGSGARVLNGPTFNVANFALPGGSFDVQGGALNLSGASSTAAGATLLVSGGTLTSSGTLVNAGTFTHAAAGTTTLTGAFTNSGAVNVNAGTLDFAGGYAQPAGNLALAGGNVVGDVIVDGGMAAGVGSITGNVTNNAGIVAVGLSPGTLVINGNYTQGPAGALDIELGGATQGVNYDLLKVTGTAALNGTLNVTLFGGFMPAAGDTFDFMTYASRSGDFSAVGLPGGGTMTAMPGATFYQLVQASPPPPAPPPPSPPPTPPATSAPGEVVALPANDVRVLQDRFFAETGREKQAEAETRKGAVPECR